MILPKSYNLLIADNGHKINNSDSIIIKYHNKDNHHNIY